MNRSLFRITAYLQIGMMVLLATGCAQTQPYFLKESPNLEHYLDQAVGIDYPDSEVESLPEAVGALRPLSIGNHDYQFWDMSLEECVNIALNNAKFFMTTGGNAPFRQNIAAQFTSGAPEQFGSVYDTAIQQTTTQGISQTVDGNGNRIIPRGVQRANQVGGVEDALAEFDAVASGFFNLNNGDRPQNVGGLNIINPQFQTSRTIQQQATLSKRLATGGIVTWREQVLYSRNNTPISAQSRAVPSDWTAILEAQITHPLMRGRGALVNRIPLVLASINEDISVTDTEIQVRNLVRDIEVAYWDLYVAYRNVSTTIIARNSEMATARHAKANFDNGNGNQQELAQAREQYFQFRGQMESALAGSDLPGDDRFGVYGRERVLREMMGLTATDGRLIRPIDEPVTARVEFDWDESVAQLLYLSPELRRSKSRLKQRELELITSKNQVLPQVDLTLLYRWVGVGDTLGPPTRRDPFPAPGSSALGGITSGDFQESQIRLDVSLPAIGLRRELARIRGSQLMLLREKNFLREAERLLISQLSEAVAKTTTHFQLVQTNAQRWQASEIEVEARLAEWRGGRSLVNVVLQSQQRRAQAQITYYRALAEYNKSFNYVDYLRGTMLANNNITLREGPWNDKAYWDALERARERAAGRRKVWGVTRPGVVRRGPVRDAQHAANFGAGGFGTDNVNVDGGIVDDLNLDPYRQPIPVDDQPLIEGGTPAEFFSPEPAQPLEVPSIIDNIPSVQPELAPPAIDVSPSDVPASPSDIPSVGGDTPASGGSILVPTNAQSSTVIGSGVAQTSHNVDQGYTPSPVRRTALPSFE